MDTGFWTFNVGHLSVGIALASLLLVLHRFNTKRIEDGTRTLTEMKTRMDLMYSWFVKHVINGKDTAAE